MIKKNHGVYLERTSKKIKKELKEKILYDKEPSLKEKQKKKEQYNKNNLNE